jgi:hypothetical protein
MWKAHDNGKPTTLDGDSNFIPIKPFWDNVLIFSLKTNQEKEIIRAGKCLGK